MKKEKIILKDRECAVCGNKFDVKLNIDNKIVSDVFYGGVVRIGVGNWSKYEMINEDGKIYFKRIISRATELKYRLLDLKKLILKQYKDVEYWECEDCKLKGDMEHGNTRNIAVTEDGKIKNCGVEEDE
jgi:hypothetical protein